MPTRTIMAPHGDGEVTAHLMPGRLVSKADAAADKRGGKHET